jgi:hypothetical protein
VQCALDRGETSIETFDHSVCFVEPVAHFDADIRGGSIELLVENGDGLSDELNVVSCGFDEDFRVMARFRMGRSILFAHRSQRFLTGRGDLHAQNPTRFRVACANLFSERLKLPKQFVVRHELSVPRCSGAFARRIETKKMPFPRPSGKGAAR